MLQLSDLGSEVANCLVDLGETAEVTVTEALRADRRGPTSSWPRPIILEKPDCADLPPVQLSRVYRRHV